MADQVYLSVTQIKSANGRLQSHKDCLRGLGLRRIGHQVRVIDNPSVRGMINKISYMLLVESD